MNNQIALNLDCMEYMKGLPDKCFQLAIVDPPYGINVANDSRFGKKSSKRAATITTNYEKKDWDLGVPTEQYWDELFRVSENQIVFGVNYFCDTRLCGGRIFWDKDVPENYTKSKGELAFKSFGVSVDYIKVTWHGMVQQNMSKKEVRIHPTQKPVNLYEKLLKKYAKEGWKILDTHLGSGSSRIACKKMGFDFVGLEIDKDYFEKQELRWQNFNSQTVLFE